MIENEAYEWSIKTKELGFPELRIFHAIIRQTNGYHKDEAEMSLRFFEKKTGIGHRNARKNLEDMFQKNIIFRRRGPKMKFGKPVYIYSINKKHCRLSGATPEICDTADATTGVSDTAEAGVRGTPIKYTNINIKNKGLLRVMNKLKGYKLPTN